MEQKLWDLCDQKEMVGACDPMWVYDSWSKFCASKSINGFIGGCKPVYWFWVDRDSEEYRENADPDEEADDVDYLCLFWLSLHPCNVRQVVVCLHKEEEPQVRVWLAQNKFIPGDDV